MDRNELTESMIQDAYAGLAALALLGFQFANQSTLPSKLRSISPSGSTNMRDSVKQGTILMLKLYSFLQERKIAGAWNFVHIILTDGEDTGSRASFEEIRKDMYTIGQLLHVKSLKTIFIGVGINDYQAKEMIQFARVGGRNAQYYNVSSLEIGEILEKISFSLGLVKRAQVLGIATQSAIHMQIKEQQQLLIQAQMQNYAVLFNLDMSGSMAGSKWKSACQSVTKFIHYLGPQDVVSGIVFNNQVKLLAPQIQGQSVQPNYGNSRSRCSCKRIIIILVVLALIGLGIFLLAR